MRRAIQIVLRAERPATPPADRLLLAFDDRHRRRLRLVAEGGTELLLDLPHAAILADGDALLLDDGRLIEIAAAAEPLMEATAASNQALARLAWHIGNRHLPAEILAGAIRLRRDHVIEAMLEGLGARVTHVDAPFHPEAGAYARARPSHAGHDDAGHDDAGHHHPDGGTAHGHHGH